MTAPPGATRAHNPINGTGTNAGATYLANRLANAMRARGLTPRATVIRSLLPTLIAEHDGREWTDAEFIAWAIDKGEHIVRRRAVAHDHRLKLVPS